ncbi:hypothetical protein J2S37_002224 [Corynebacterium felinum]|uniref:Uncharacterized protein n=1 Tax=Corynebacterium felinum TaxID=131318 RepID=A0ABU2BBE4_9CORY|nr:hypothetical protein [Corynebacterium felinum]
MEGIVYAMAFMSLSLPCVHCVHSCLAGHEGFFYLIDSFVAGLFLRGVFFPCLLITSILSIIWGR